MTSSRPQPTPSAPYSGQPEPVALSGSICRLISENIDSVHTLEILLFLRQNREQRFLVNAVQDSIKSSTAAIRQSLMRLVAGGFAEHTGAGAAEAFRFSPRSPELDQLTTELAVVYAQRQPAVIEKIYQRPS